MHGFTVRFENALPAVEDIRSRIDMKSNLCRRSAQIANLNCIEQKAFMGGTFQWNKMTDMLYQCYGVKDNT